MSALADTRAGHGGIQSAVVYLKTSSTAQWCQSEKKSAFYFEIYGSSFAAENKGHWRWAIFCGHEKKPVQVGSFHVRLPPRQNTQKQRSRLKERAKKGAPLHTN
jgi:hypothetical protein